MILQNVSKKFGQNSIIDDVSCEIETGKITAILGESGAGKSTLLNLISRVSSFEGKIEGAGRISYLFQSSMLLPNLTVEGNLRFVLDEAEWDKIDEMLDCVGMLSKKTRYPNRLSGGERRRVAIARAFLFPHDTLLMDEPFSSLDLSLKRSLISLVATLWRTKQNTVVFVTHDPHEAAILAHTGMVLKEGKLSEPVPLGNEPPRDFLVQSDGERILVRTLLGEKN